MLLNELVVIVVLDLELVVVVIYVEVVEVVVDSAVAIVVLIMVVVALDGSRVRDVVPVPSSLFSSISDIEDIQMFLATFIAANHSGVYYFRNLNFRKMLG